MTAPHSTASESRTLTYVRLSDVRPAARNPKKHDIPAIIESLKRFGWTNPLLPDERTGRLVGGHGRLAAAVQMRAEGDDPPHGVVVDYDGEWCAPTVRGWASRDDVEAAAYLAADNHLTEAGGWDNRGLAELVQEVAEAEPALLDAMAFYAEDLDALFKHLNDAGEAGKFDLRTASGVITLDDLDQAAKDEEPGDRPSAPQPRYGEVECPDCGHVFVPGR